MDSDSVRMGARSWEKGDTVRPGPVYNPPPKEGDWVRHPCCGMVCMMRSAPLRKITNREWLGPAPP